MAFARVSSSAMPSASSIAGAMTSAKESVPNSSRATSPASTIPGTSAGIKPATGMMPFSPPGSSASNSPASIRRERNSSADAIFGIVPTPGIANTFPSLVRIGWALLRRNRNGRTRRRRRRTSRQGRHPQRFRLYEGCACRLRPHSRYLRLPRFQSADGLANGPFTLYIALGERRRMEALRSSSTDLRRISAL